MERKLVERAMHGDEEAFDALIERVGNQLHSVARRILRDSYLAEDATQRALLEAWQNLPRVRLHLTLPVGFVDGPNRSLDPSSRRSLLPSRPGPTAA